MCGIYGYLSHDGSSLPDDTLRAMGHSLQHRGPDDSGVFAAPGIALGNQRLSIIDVAAGHQPFHSADGDITVVQNGEIFNYVELSRDLARSGYPCTTHSDTEVILRLYQRDGLDFVQQLNGMFSIAIYDGRRRELYLIRDRVGVKPLFVAEHGQQLIFASEIKALLQAGVPMATDLQALHHFLTYNFVPPPLTIFDNVKHVLPGHLLVVKRGRVEQRQWWDLAARESADRPEQDWIDEFNALLEDAVRLRLRSDVPFGAFLSGGIDSSTVVGLMARNMDRPVDTFSIGFDDPRYDESAFAALAAERFGCRHRMQRVSPRMLDMWPRALYFCDQPHGDVSFLPTHKVASLAAEQVKVVLTGDGGDELFAGYDKYRDFFADGAHAQTSDSDFRRAYYRNIGLFSDAEKQTLYGDELAAAVAGDDSFGQVEPLFQRARHLDRVNQALYIDMMLLLPGNNLVKPDRMGMAVSLEARTPFLDYRMMELAFRMPGSLKLHRGQTKHIFKTAVKDLIGDELTYRKKQMFTVPIGDWFKSELAEYCENLLLSERSFVLSLFRRRAVADMLQHHRSGQSNYTRQIRALVAIELWHGVFHERPDMPDPQRELAMST